MVAGVHEGERLAALGPWARALDRASEVPEGLRVTLPLIDMPAHLRWLEGRVAAAGGVVERRTVRAFAEAAAEARVVVNCTGLGARELVPDPGVRPVRGQLVVVENPGIDEWFTHADPSSSATTYFFPQPGLLVLEGPRRWTIRGRSPTSARRGRSWSVAHGCGRRSRGPASSATGWG